MRVSITLPQRTKGKQNLLPCLSMQLTFSLFPFPFPFSSFLFCFLSSSTNVAFAQMQRFFLLLSCSSDTLWTSQYLVTEIMGGVLLQGPLKASSSFGGQFFQFCVIEILFGYTSMNLHVFLCH